MNISDVSRAYKEQSAPIFEHSESPSNIVTYTYSEESKIADEFLAGGGSYYDISVNYKVRVKDLKKWVEKRRGVKVHCKDFSHKKEVVINLSKLCSNAEISRRLSIPLKSVSRILSENKDNLC